MTCDDCGGRVRIVTLFAGSAAERPAYMHAEPIVGIHAAVVSGEYDPPRDDA